MRRRMFLYPSNVKTISSTLPFTVENTTGENLLDWSITGGTSGTGESLPNLMKFYSITGNGTYYDSDNRLVVPKTGYINGTFRDLCPNLEVGKNYKCYFARTPSTNIFYLPATQVYGEYFNGNRAITEGDLNSRIYIYAGTINYIVMVEAGQSNPTDKHYGYKIPITASNGVNSQTVNIYKDTILASGETITKASTGIDIPTYSGSTTYSTTLTNPPSDMMIKYEKEEIS